MARFLLETGEKRHNVQIVHLDVSVCPYLHTDLLADKLENNCLIKMQVRPDGSSVSSINRTNVYLVMSGGILISLRFLSNLFNLKSSVKVHCGLFIILFCCFGNFYFLAISRLLSQSDFEFALLDSWSLGYANVLITRVSVCQ